MTDIRQVLEDAFKVIHPEPPCDWMTWDDARISEQRAEDQMAFTRWNDWRLITQVRFRRFLDAEAWTSAAEMLVLPGWDSISIRRTDDGFWHVQLAGNDAHLMAEDPDEFWVEVEDFAEQWDAIRAACIKAKENTDGR